MSGGEILVILLVVLIFFGSKGIPSVARKMGKAMHEFRNATGDIQREIQKGANDIKNEVNLNRQLKDEEKKTNK